MYDETTDGMFERLVRTTTPRGLTFLAELDHEAPVDRFDHLECYVPGSAPLLPDPVCCW